MCLLKVPHDIEAMGYHSFCSIKTKGAGDIESGTKIIKLSETIHLL